jgi:hypothetical protein
MFEHLFREFPTISNVVNDAGYMVLLQTVGNGLVAVTFFTIGLMCIIMAKFSPEGETKTKSRIIMTQLFGLFLISCSFSRAIAVLCLYHNYAYVNGYVSVLTGLLSMFALLYIPRVIKEANYRKSVIELEKNLKDTNKNIEDLKEIVGRINPEN